MSIWNYLILNIIGKIRNNFENNTECEHDNVGKFWGKNKWKLLHTETFKRLVWAVSIMDNARKRYFNIESLSSRDIFALLDSIEGDDQGDIENIMNDSDTEFVAKDESIISTNIIWKEEIGEQSSSVSVAEASVHILSTQNEIETDTLGQAEPNYGCAAQRTSNQSPSPATQYTADESPTAVVTRRTSDQSSKSTPPPTVTLPKSTKKRKQSRMIKDKTKKKKVNAPSDENNTNQKKGSVLQDKDKTKKKKTNTTQEWKWEDKEKPMTKKGVTLEAEVLVNPGRGSAPFETVSGMNEVHCNRNE